jgi:hypothetical protein
MPTNSQNPQTEQKQNKNQIKLTNPWERERERHKRFLAKPSIKIIIS